MTTNVLRKISIEPFILIYRQCTVQYFAPTVRVYKNYVVILNPQARY